MADDTKKIDLDDLDLSGLGSTISATEDSEPETDEDAREEWVSDGYWINHKSIKTVEPREMADWISDKLPGTNPDGFSESALNSTQKREAATDKVIWLYAQLNYAFPRKGKHKEYTN